MKLYLSKDGTWTGTQADARKGGKDYIEREVPTSKPELIAWLNEQWALLQGDEPASDQLGVGRGDQEHREMEEHYEAVSRSPDAPYQNGDPTTVHLKSRNPAAVTTCLICGRDERAQKLVKARIESE